jgi:exonuclease VII large subunit
MRDHQGKLVRSLAQLRSGEAIEVQIVDGRLRAVVEELLPDATSSS